MIKKNKDYDPNIIKYEQLKKDYESLEQRFEELWLEKEKLALKNARLQDKIDLLYQQDDLK